MIWCNLVMYESIVVSVGTSLVPVDEITDGRYISNASIGFGRMIWCILVIYESIVVSVGTSLVPVDEITDGRYVIVCKNQRY